MNISSSTLLPIQDYADVSIGSTNQVNIHEFLSHTLFIEQRNMHVGLCCKWNHVHRHNCALCVSSIFLILREQCKLNVIPCHSSIQTAYFAHIYIFPISRKYNLHQQHMYIIQVIIKNSSN